MVMPKGKEVKSNKIGKFKVEPMKRVMIVPYEKAPIGSLDKNEIQANKLIEGKKYKISTRLKSEKDIQTMKDEVMTLIKCYPNHYLFETENGIKHSFSKVNHMLGEWRAEE